LPASTVARKGANPSIGPEQLHDLVLASLDDDQAVDTISIPLTGKSSIADHMVIASGRSTRQVASMANKLVDRIKAETGRIARIEGLPTADWVLIDAGDVIVHLFRPEVRSFYNLERMWAFGEAPPPPPGAAPVEPADAPGDDRD
jgi:ribosome-associated protein